MTVIIKEPQKITVATQILRGAAGADGTTTIKDYGVAAISLSGHKVVCKDEVGQLIYADPNLNNYGALGITTGAISQGVVGEFLVFGTIEEPSWTWETGKLLFLQTDGMIAQTPSTTGFILEIGRALSSTKILVQIQSIILR